MNDIKVSIVIPVYKVEAYLRRCVDSAVSQTLKEIEIILVDDGSPDGCPTICDEYAASDKRIHVIHKENGGLASARNAGMRIAQGEYLFFLDSDDWLDPNGMELLYQKAEEYQVDFVRYRAIRSGWPGRPEHTPAMLGAPREIPGGYYDRRRIIEEVYPKLLATAQLTMGAIVGAWGSLYRLSFLKKNKLCFFETVKFSEDQIFSAYVVKAAQSFYYIDTGCVYHYFYNPNSISKSFRAGRWESCKETIRLAEAGFGDDSEYDFSDEINWLKWFCILLALGEHNYLTLPNEKKEYCRTIMRDPVTKKSKLRLKRFDVPVKLKIELILVKIGAVSIVAHL